MAALRIVARNVMTLVNNRSNICLIQSFSNTGTKLQTYNIKSHDDFLAKVMRSEKPVIVNFHAEWCEPCKILTPELKKLIEPMTDIDLAVVDVESHADLVHTFEVKAVPAVIAVRDGLVVDKFIGLVDSTMIKNLVDKLHQDIDQIKKS
ncbi:thioredoxin, mitochondrial [Chrysoperla carnea]|uniref:thioredoxin, mitochondrial n=1 Tax=Chrysoperla carnea TaxID=189513 RepID=UPI001D09041F|nr:thioredoxin, mitochondrial [Chrysoperla carnea]